MAFWSRVANWFGRAEESATKPQESPPGTAQRSPEEVFTVQVESLFREMPEVEAVRRNPGDFSLTVEHDGTEHVVYLGNVFKETRDLAPEDRRRRLGDFVQLIRTSSDDVVPWGEARDRIVPLLRPATIYAGISMADGCALIKRPFLPMLVEAIGLDFERSMQLVTANTARDWGVPVDQLFPAARGTLAACVTEVGPYDPESPYPLWYVTTDDSYESSRLLLPGWLASFSDKVNGTPVAIVPHKTLLIVGGDADEGCLRRLLDTAKREYEASTRSISPALYTVDDLGTVIPLVLPPEHPLSNDVELAHVVLASVEYSAQREPLQAELGEQVLVAEYTGVRRDDGTVTSYSIWPKDVATLLPVTKEVILITDSDTKATLRVPWSAVATLAPTCFLAELELNPPRYRTVRWPTSEELANLKSPTPE